jgi:hypothetical protein
MDFIDYLTEAPEKHGVLAYGRMNPPTKGHEQVINKVHELAKAHNAVHKVVLSHSQDSNKNPLPADVKVKHAKNAFPGTHIEAATKEHPTIMHHASEMFKSGVKHLHVVAGSDRVEEYHKLLHRYNGVEGKHGHYKFKSIQVHSSGERDPDAEGTSGISGTKMREHATAGRKNKFHSGLPSGMKQEHKEALYHDLRHHMGIQEAVASGSQGEVKISKFEWGTPEGTKEMKRITPGESKVKTEEKEADYGSKFQDMMKRVKVSAQQGPKKTVWVPAKYGTGGSYKVVPVKPVKETVEVESMQLTPTKIPFLLMSSEQKRALFEETNQLEFDGIQTKHLDMCPGAYKEFKSMIADIRAGKHLGEPTGHHPDKLPYPGAIPEQGLRPEEIKTGVTSTHVHNQVAAGMAMKPERLRQMQFRQYTGL